MSLLEQDGTELAGFITIPDMVESIFPNITKHEVIYPFVGTKFYITVRFHHHPKERCNTTFSNDTTRGIIFYQFMGR